MFEIVARELRAKLLGRRRGQGGLRDDALSHTQQHSTAGVEGAGGSGGHGRASRSTTPSEARVWRSRGRPGPTAPGTPAEPQATSSIANSGCGGRGRWRGQAGLRGDTPSHAQQHSTAGVEGAGGSGGPGCGARRRWRGPAGQRVNAPSHTSAARRHWCGGRRRDRRARAGFEIDHSEPQARVWRSRGRPGPTAPRTPAAS